MSVVAECMQDHLRIKCHFCGEIFFCGDAPHDEDGSLCPQCGRGEDLDEYDMPIVYVAGPFREKKHRSEREVNSRRAVAVANLAVQRGLSPIVIHPAILLGAYGEDDSPRDRANGLEIACKIVRAVAGVPKSKLWVIKTDDGGLSEGTQVEVEAWKGEGGMKSQTLMLTWDEWVLAGARKAK